MLKKMDPKNVRYIIIILVVLALVITYRFGYTPIGDKIAEVESENQVLRAEANRLMALEASKSVLQGENDAVTKELEDIQDSFAVKLTPEKYTKIIDDLEHNTNVYISQIQFNDEEEVYLSESLDENNVSRFTGRISVMTLQFQGDYKSTKKMLDYIKDYPEKMAVREFSATANSETGLLEGNIVINRYLLTGFDKEYMPPSVSGVKIKTDNIYKAGK